MTEAEEREFRRNVKLVKIAMLIYIILCVILAHYLIMIILVQVNAEPLYTQHKEQHGISVTVVYPGEVYGPFNASVYFTLNRSADVILYIKLYSEGSEKAKIYEGHVDANSTVHASAVLHPPALWGGRSVVVLEFHLSSVGDYMSVGGSSVPALVMFEFQGPMVHGRKEDEISRLNSSLNSCESDLVKYREAVGSYAEKMEEYRERIDELERQVDAVNFTLATCRSTLENYMDAYERLNRLFNQTILDMATAKDQAHKYRVLYDSCVARLQVCNATLLSCKSQLRTARNEVEFLNITLYGIAVLLFVVGGGMYHFVRQNARLRRENEQLKGELEVVGHG